MQVVGLFDFVYVKRYYFVLSNDMKSFEKIKNNNKNKEHATFSCFMFAIWRLTGEKNR